MKLPAIDYLDIKINVESRRVHLVELALSIALEHHGAEYIPGHKKHE